MIVYLFFLIAALFQNLFEPHFSAYIPLRDREQDIYDYFLDFLDDCGM